MLARYLKLFWSKILLLLVAIALVVVSSVAKGKIAVVTSTIAGVIMIYLAVSAIIWIVKTPIKKEKDTGV